VFYAASIADDPASTFYNQLARIDVTTGDTEIWRKSGHYPGEAVFVKNPSGEDPDDGAIERRARHARLGLLFGCARRENVE
jgi:carotenoid cleavage dioxygenase-like enzyme